jgi:hypothetical protein
MISIEEFKNKYILYNFDDLLNEQNSSYINSNEHYLQYKNNYISITDDNYKKIKNLIKNYNNYICNKTECNITNKIMYKYICPNKKEHITQAIYSILKSQNENYINLISHINFLLSIN